MFWTDPQVCAGGGVSSTLEFVVEVWDPYLHYPHY